MPTRAGWSLLAGSVGLAAAGRIVAITECPVVGVAGLALFVATGLWSAARRPTVQVVRRIDPGWVALGAPATATLVVAGAGRPTPPLTLLDAIEGAGGARHVIAPIGPGSPATVTHRLPTGRRGLLATGPLTVETTDPFALWRRRTIVAGTASLLVLPAVERLRGAVRGQGDLDLLAGGPRAVGAGATDGDVARLRPYVVGDDLRRVHWPSTARRGDLLTRQDEPPDDGRVLIVLDVDPRHLDPDAFEVAVSAAASLAVHVLERGDRAEVMTTDGSSTGPVAGTAGAAAVGSFLAVATQLAPAPGAPAPAWTTSDPTIPRVVVTGPAARPSTTTGRHDVIVEVEPRVGPPSGGQTGAATPASIAEPARRITVPAGVSFARAWDAQR